MRPPIAYRIRSFPRPVLALLLLLASLAAGCGAIGSTTKSEDQARAAQARIEAAFGETAYTTILTPRAVLREGVFDLLDHQEFERLESLFAAMQQSKLEWGDTTSLEQEMFASMVPDNEDDLAGLKYRLDLWAAASDSNLPELVRASVSSQFLVNHPVWKDNQERQNHILQASLAMSDVYKAGQHPRNLAEAEYWESYLRVAVFSRASQERLDELLAEVMKRDPRRWTACVMRAQDAHPFYTGERTLLPAMVEKIATAYGPEVQAVCAWRFYELSGFDPATVPALKLDPEKVQEGFAALRKTHPDSRLLLSRQARLAKESDQTEPCRELLLELGEDWDASVFEADSHQTWCAALDVQPEGVRLGMATLPVGPERDLFTIPEVAAIKLQTDTRALWLEQRYWSLEALAEKLRREDPRRLESFYLACDRQGDTKAERIELRNRCESWLKTIGGSPTASLVLARDLISSAWEARGDGWGSQVTAEGGARFKKDLEEAARLLDGAPLVDDPSCAARITIAMGLGQPRTEVDAALDRAAKLDPGGAEALSAAATYLLPRWHGGVGELSSFAGQLAKRRDPAALARLLVASDAYFEAKLEELPYPMVDQSLKVAEAEKGPLSGIRFLRFRVERHYGHASKMEAAVSALAGSPDRWALVDNELRAWMKNPKLGPMPAKAQVIESGLYINRLPTPVLDRSQGPFPLIPGRSLGIKLRFQTDVSTEQTLYAVVTRKDPATGESYEEYRQAWLAPDTMKKGEERLVRWLIEENTEPGVWLVRVQTDEVTLAERAFEMQAVKQPAETGLKLEFQGLTAADRTLPILTPLSPGEEIPMKIGNGFGFLVTYLGPMPSQGRYRWIPPDKPGSREIQEPWVVLRCDNPKLLPAQGGSYMLEAPKELIPGVWKLAFELNGHSMGELRYHVRP